MCNLINLNHPLELAAIFIITTARAMPVNNPRNAVRSAESTPAEDQERQNTNFALFAFISIGALVLCFAVWLVWHRYTEGKASHKSDSGGKASTRSMKMSMKLQRMRSQRTLGNDANEDDQMTLAGEVVEKEASSGKLSKDNTQEAMPEALVSAHLK